LIVKSQRKKRERAERKEEKVLPCNTENMKRRLEVLVPKMKKGSL